MKWQDDDLPIFGKIQDILVINKKVLFSVLHHTTSGIDQHYHSFVVVRTEEVSLFWLHEIVDEQPLRAHVLFNGNLYITLRSHIEKL